MNLSKNRTLERKTGPAGAWAILLSCCILGGAAVLTMLGMRACGVYASGNDIWGHLFKSQLMYDSLQEGSLYPLYTPLWYNGIQPYRYWAPLPYYVMAGLQMLTGGNLESAYYLFAGVSLVLGGIPWILLAKKYNRIFLGAILGILWFFMPENIRVYLCEGNLPRMVTAVTIPWLILSIHNVLRDHKIWSYVGIMLFTAATVLSHAMISAMMGIGTFLFLVFDLPHKRDIRVRIFILGAMLAGIALSGIWLIPGLSGGLVSMSEEASAAVMESLMYSLGDSLDPFNRLNGIIDTFYYGLSIVLISAAGLILAKKGTKSGYVLTFVILVCTTPAMLPILRKMPMSQLFWMMRFAIIVYGFFFLSFIEWNTMKKAVCAAGVALIILDCIPSFLFQRYKTQPGDGVVQDAAQIQALTDQRAALLDLSTFGSYPSWGLCTGEKPAQYTYGWAWQGAATASNIVMLNTAMEQENYPYIFSRCLELGNDCVAFPKYRVGMNGKTKDDLIQAAENQGYVLAASTHNCYIFDYPDLKNFGVKTAYTGLCIGTYANTATLYYPAFTVGNSVYVDDYSPEQLRRFSSLFLSGFQYRNKEKAEQILRDAAQSGVRIVIDAAHLPADHISKRLVFLGVTADTISMEGGYPDIYFAGEKVDSKPFAQEYRTWNTAFLGNVKHVLGTMEAQGEEIPFVGYNDENIIFLGMNYMFHATETQDPDAFRILSRLLKAEYMKLPEIKLIPTEITYSHNHIHIESAEPGVNTTLAFQDNFISRDPIRNENNLLIADNKVTDVEIVYFGLRKGMMVSLAGLVIGAGLIGAEFWLRRRKRPEAASQSCRPVDDAPREPEEDTGSCKL